MAKEVTMTKSLMRKSLLSLTVAVSAIASEGSARADDAPPAVPEVKVGGWVETYYSFNANRPANGINSVRAFDIHDGFNLQNAALDVDVKKGADAIKVTFQSGNLGMNTYDPLEPTATGTAYTAATGANALRYLQQAYATHAFDNGLTVTAGLFATPVGYETYNVKDNWNWTRANTFYFLTYYHVGAKAAYALSKEWTASAYLMNGWNNGFETNATPSGAVQLGFDNGSGTTASVVYLVGNERKRTESEDFGKPLRHLVDAWVSAPIGDTFSVGLHADTGLESNKKGEYSWLAGAAYARAKVAPWAFVAARGDYFKETAGDPSAPMFFLSANGAKAIGSGTLTFDVRPTESTSFRLEARHDVADGEVFFKKTPPKDSTTGADVFNADSQTTVLLGMNTAF